MMKVMVVGGAGYVGSVLCRELLTHGHEVRVLDSLLFGNRGIRDLEGVSLSEVNASEVYPSVFRGLDAVVNLAGFSNDPTAEFRPDINWNYNVSTAARIAWAACEAGVPRLVYASSASVYHAENAEFDAEITERHIANPHFHYSTSKLAGEMASLTFHKPSKFDVTVLRKGTVCGPSPRMRFDLLLNTVFRSAMTTGVIELHGGGWVYRPLLGIRDAARAYRMLIEAPGEIVGGQIFNATSENGTVRSYAERMAGVLGLAGRKIECQAVPQRNIVRSYKISARKIMERLGWVPLESAESISGDLLAAHEKGELPAFDDPNTENIKVMERLLCA